MSIDDVTKSMHDLAATKEAATREAARARRRPTKRLPLFGLASERTARVAAAGLLLLAAGLFAWQARPSARPPAPGGLQMSHITEVFQPEDNQWFAEGVLQNGSEPLSEASYVLCYTDGPEQIVTQVMVEARGLQKEETRKFRVSLPGYSSGLKRQVVPGTFKQ